jgi:hypothetical protein
VFGARAGHPCGHNFTPFCKVTPECLGILVIYPGFIGTKFTVAPDPYLKSSVICQIQASLPSSEFFIQKNLGTIFSLSL